jgi:uncharacterized membrane protein
MNDSTHNTKEAFDDRRLEILIGRLLQTGVLLASAVVLAGGVLYLHAHAHARTDYRDFKPDAATLASPAALVRGLRSADPAAIIELGILLLIATPIARVAFAAVGFAIEKDRMYVLVSVAVLTVLLLSLFH